MRTRFLLSLEKPAATCRTCELVLPCRHDSALLLSSEDLLLLLGALRAHREHVASWQAERLDELRGELTARVQVAEAATPWRPFLNQSDSPTADSGHQAEAAE